MSDEIHPLIDLLQQDSRYTLEAYQFIRDALEHGQDVLGLSGQPEEEIEKELGDPFDVQSEQHLTGQQLCEAIRHYALQQYGYMSKVVLNQWGLKTTGDFGEIVYNLIRIGMMKRSDTDRREDFDDCYDFTEAFQQQFEITMPRETP
jgi:uncharacterized repeat protein (TIGR04138 family)